MYLSSLLGLLLWQAGLCTIGTIALSEPLAGLDDLDNVDPLLEQHDGQGDKGEGPRNGTIHLVCSSHLHGTGGPGAGEEGRRLRGRDGRTRLEGGALAGGLQERG